MTALTTRRYVLARRPVGYPEADVFRLESTPILGPGDGEVLMEAVYVSVDPYLRGRMSDQRSYIAPFQVDEPIVGGLVGRVVESRAPGLEPGDLVTGYAPWQERVTVGARHLRRIDGDPALASLALGALGMPGLTAYFGMLDIGAPKAGETVLVSGAAGAVGSVAAQIAKRAGARVVGMAGSDEKTRWLLGDLGLDAAINYRTTDYVMGALTRTCPRGVDVFFDNVGGPLSDAVMPMLNDFARVPLCGQISLYNAAKPPMGPRILPLVLTKRVRLQGFIVSDFEARFPEGLAALTEWVGDGSIKTRETILEGFESLPDAFLGLFSGDNIGKMLVKVAD